MRYARAELDLKRQALAQVVPNALVALRKWWHSAARHGIDALALAPVILRGSQLLRAPQC